MSTPHLEIGIPSNQSTQDALATSSDSFEQGLRNMILGNKSQSQIVSESEVMNPHEKPQSVNSVPVPVDSSSSKPNPRTIPAEDPVSSRTSGKTHEHWRQRSARHKQQASHRDAGASPDITADDRLPFSIKPARQPKRRQNVKNSPASPKVPNPESEPTTLPSNAQYQGTAEVKQPYRPKPVDVPQDAFQMQSGHVDRLKSSNRDSDRRTQNYKPAFSPPTRQFQARPPPFYNRPPPQHRQLYNPHTDYSQSYHSLGPQTSFHQRQIPFQAFQQAQIKYLDALAEREFPKAVMSAEEEHRKESLRQALEDVCQRAVVEYEITKDALFDGSTVALECFGSLRSGFATQSSDMDLAFESPLSKPDVSSPESEIPRLLEKTLLGLGYGARLLTKTRVPILRFCETPTPELRDRLQAERLKWEKERDTPSKAKKAKQPKTKEGQQETAGKKKKDGEDSEEFRPAPNEKKHQSVCSDKGREEAAQEDPLSLHTDGLEAEDSSSHSTPSDAESKAAHTDQGQDPTPKIVKVSDVAEADIESNLAGDVQLEHRSLHNNEGSSDPLKESKGQAIDPDQSVTATEGIAKETALESNPAIKERLEKSLPDEELVRLYGLAMNEGWFEPRERDIIYAFFKAVKNGSSEQQAEFRSRLFELPDILNRYRPPPDHHLDFPKDGVGIQCDINFSNRLALHNSAMLKCYNLSDPRVKPMVLFVKAWTKRRKINSPYHGTLSSYGYVLMVLHYLVNVAKPPICLNLQTVPMATQGASAESSRLPDGQEVRFWRDEKEIQRWAQRDEITSDRDSSVGSLLQGFFQYFATVSGGFSWGTEVLSLRTPGGILSKKDKDWIAAKTVVLDPIIEGQQGQEVRQRYLFAIEDPFETDHNIARTVVHNGIVAIRDEFRRANRLIRDAGNGRIMEDLFEEAEAKDDLNHRHFGPRPRPPQEKKAPTTTEQAGGGTTAHTVSDQMKKPQNPQDPKVSTAAQPITDGPDHPALAGKAL
ncbi:MAG: hypothetical protein Q9222_006558 [Ikaeria aurantiellina]